jgi:hypothetical protein
MSMLDRVSTAGPLPQGVAEPRRRFLLARLLALPVLSVAITSAWWRSSEAVVVRNGWVLSRDD